MSPQKTKPLPKVKLRTVAAIPCFNTERYIRDIVSRARRHVDLVIAIDDGSCDNTAKEASMAGALVVSHKVNKGYGEAIKSCFEAAKANKADVLVILDGDGQHNPDEIPRLLSPITASEADLVVGSRFISDNHSVPQYRSFGIGIITLLWNLGARIKVSDAQSGFRAYSKKIFEALSLNEKGMAVSIETIEKARKQAAIIKEVPISCRYDTSTFALPAFKHGLSVALSVIRIRFKNNLHRWNGNHKR